MPYDHISLGGVDLPFGRRTSLASPLFSSTTTGAPSESKNRTVQGELCSSELLSVPDSIVVRSERTLREAHRWREVVRVPGARHR